MSSRFTLENPHIVLKLDPMASRMMFRRPDTGTRLESSIPTLSYLESGRPKRLTLMQVGSMGEMKPHAAPFRDHQSLRWEETVEGFKLALEWAIPSYAPHILWRWSLRNMRSDPIRLQRALMLACANQAFLEQTGAGGLCKGFPRGTLSRDGLDLTFPGLPATLAVYLPGWQSWSYGGWVMAEDRVPRSRLGPLTLPIIYDQARNPPRTQGHFRSEMFAAVLDTQTRANLTCGFLSQRQSFGSVDVRIHGDARALSVTMDLDGLKLDPNAEFHSDWACLQLGDHGVEGLEDYAALVGSFNQARVAEKASVGWCSWYGYGQAITEAEITANVEAASAVFDQTPSRVIQIDDGFQTEIGDWLSIGPAFPSGMRQVANTIKHAGYEAGIWLAPFIALSRSRVVKNHPDWILRSKWGMPANTGFVWNQFGRAFDPTHPGFLEYLQQVVATATADWGYAYLKLDFLYAGALAGIRHDPGYTRAQAFYKALRLIRETVGGSVTLVGCGCPLGAGIGIFDRMRIGPDVAAHWKPSIPPMTRLLSKEPTLPGAVNAIRNT
ncbi:MAG: alpha-galactosidase, partial [Anaerolineales bacterium]